jgi:hypothetical protein
MRANKYLFVFTLYHKAAFLFFSPILSYNNVGILCCLKFGLRCFSFGVSLANLGCRIKNKKYTYLPLWYINRAIVLPAA